MSVCRSGEMYFVLGLTGWPTPLFRHQFGDTPLHKSAANGHTEMTSTLIGANADVDAVNKVSGDEKRVSIHSRTLHFILQSVYPRAMYRWLFD